MDSLEYVPQTASYTIKVLDRGFVTLHNVAGPTRRQLNVDHDGDCFLRDFDADDTDFANSARMSFDQMNSGRTREDDLKLAAYLMRNRHTTPIEMVTVWLEMKLPIFVARQFVRHRTVSINEVSGRYVTLPAEWYIPDVVGGAASNKKQGQVDNLSQEMQHMFKQELDQDCKESYNKYLYFINRGVAPEHARMFLHTNHYTHWLWKQDLHNLMHFLSLRDHSHAQIEAQLYAQAITSLLEKALPDAMELYRNFRRHD